MRKAALLSLCIALSLSGCATFDAAKPIVKDRLENRLNEATQTVDGVQDLMDKAGERFDRRALKQLCKRMRVESLFETFDTQATLDAWSIICRKVNELELPTRETN